MFDAATGIQQLITGFVEKVSQGAQNFVLWLISVAVLLVGWLPDHTPIAWPDPATWGVAFRGLSIVGRYFHLPVLFGSLGLMLGWGTVVMLYAVYRAVLGFIPTFK